MSNFDLFRTKMQLSENCRVNHESSFIFEGTSAVNIHVLRLNVDKQAALIVKEKEGPDTSIVFTLKESNYINELLKADYFTWKKKTYFVFEDLDLVREVHYKKQKAYECNVDFNINNITYYGYYVSSLAKYIDNTLENKLNITTNDKPVLIMPQYDWLQVGLKIKIKDKPYKIIDFDIITNDGIAYISLERDFNSKNEDKEIIQEELDVNTLKAGVEIKMPIQYGFFKTSSTVDIISKTATSVKFIIPYGIDNIDITIKDANKKDINKTYKVVL